MKPGDTCPFCGGKIALKDAKGESWPYRDIPSLKIEETVLLPRCTSCGEGWLQEDETAALEHALRLAYEAHQEGEGSGAPMPERPAERR